MLLSSICLQLFIFIRAEIQLGQGFPEDRSLAFFNTNVKEDRSLRVKRGTNTKGNTTAYSLCVSDVSSAEMDKLKMNTHQFIYKHDGASSMNMTWVGNGTGVVLALVWLNLQSDGFLLGTSSKLYRSVDYGKSFVDISGNIQNSSINDELGIHVGPGNAQRVILSANVSPTEEQGGRIYTSTDAGKSFKNIDVPFHLQRKIEFHPTNPDYLLGFSTYNSLWLSLDFGMSWNMVHEYVYNFAWGMENTILLTTYSANIVEPWIKGHFYLEKSVDLGKTFHSLASNVYSFGQGGHFLFVSVVKKKDQARKIQVSLDQGDTWNDAQLPAVSQEQFYSILAANEETLFMHVDAPGDTNSGTIYVSDDRGILYSKSLTHHLCASLTSGNDFMNVTSLRGVYITSVVDKDSSIHSVISFDRGGTWRPIKKPINVKCNSSATYNNKCKLHIHGKYSITQDLNVPIPPLAASNAVGLIIAHGSLERSGFDVIPDVYISNDGGYTWLKSLAGPHYYAVLDSGGLIIAVEHTPDTIQVVKFSSDEGQCWKVYKFTDKAFYFVDFSSELGTKSMIIILWGYWDNNGIKTWISFTIDFEELQTRDCEDSDYVQWLAHSTNEESETNGCLLGYKETFRRLKQSSVCRNGKDYVVSIEQKPCPCTKEDYFCDFGYYRSENTSDCVEEPGLIGHDIEFCVHGNEELLRTQGYRKIPGDKCEGGFATERVEEILTRCKVLPSQSESAPTRVIVIIVSVLTLISALSAATVLILKKHVCSGRSLEYRLSALQENEDDFCITDDMDYATSTRLCRHESDEELIQ